MESHRPGREAIFQSLMSASETDAFQMKARGGRRRSEARCAVVLGRAEEGIGRCAKCGCNRMHHQIGRRWNPIQPDHEFFGHGKRVLIQLLLSHCDRFKE